MFSDRYYIQWFRFVVGKTSSRWKLAQVNSSHTDCLLLACSMERLVKRMLLKLKVDERDIIILCRPSHAMKHAPNFCQNLFQLLKQEAFEKCWAHSRLRAASRPLTRCRYRYCRAPPTHRCPRRQRRQRQRMTEGTAMAPLNGPN